MKPIIRLFGYLKIVALWIARKLIGPEEVKSDYDTVASTYNRWNDRMAKHTACIVPKDLALRLPNSGKGAKILDFACGEGTVSRLLVQAMENVSDWDLSCVDISPEMLSRCKATVKMPRATFTAQEGISYLATIPDNSIDAVFCGWGMVYFKHAVLLKEFTRILKPNGLCGCIMNRNGSMKGVEAAVLDVMTAHPRAFSKIMDIRFSLPKNLQTWLGWFRRRRFEALSSGEGEEIVRHNSLSELYSWITETGAFSGCEQIFDHPEEMRDTLIQSLGSVLRDSNGLFSNHRFVWGIFIKKGK